MKLAVIIPTLNEAHFIGRLVTHLKTAPYHAQLEIYVCDGGSSDNTVDIATEHGATVLKTGSKGRALQMNAGASQTKADVLYFVHADTLPPVSFYSDIKKAVEAGYCIGAYRQCFDSPKLLLKVNAWFTRFPYLWCRGGDQSIFVERQLFEELNGFDERFIIMEEYDLMVRAAAKSRFKVMHGKTLVSARKYSHNSWLTVMLANRKALRMFRKKEPPELILTMYRNRLQNTTK